VFGIASAICFLLGRMRFHHVSGALAQLPHYAEVRLATDNCGCAICLIGYGLKNAIALEPSGLGSCARLQPNAKTRLNSVCSSN
jgi:hypothetical protein